MSRDRSVDVARAELAAAGIAADVSSTSSGHHKVAWAVGSKKFLVHLSKTSGDHREIANARALIRRKLRESGTIS